MYEKAKYSNSPGMFCQLSQFSFDCLLPVNTRKASCFAITYVSAYTYSITIRCLMTSYLWKKIPLIASYSATVATPLAVLPLYHQIPLYNEL